MKLRTASESVGWLNSEGPLTVAPEPEQELTAAIEAFVQRVNARAEADMLNGRPVTGAHHRAIEAELQALKMRNPSQ